MLSRSLWPWNVFIRTAVKAVRLLPSKAPGLPAASRWAYRSQGRKPHCVSVQQNRIVVQAPAEGLTGTITLTDGARTVDVGNYTYQALSLRKISPAQRSRRFAHSHYRRRVWQHEIAGRCEDQRQSSERGKRQRSPAGSRSAGKTQAAAPYRGEVDGKSSTGPVFRYQAITAVKPLTGGAGTRVVIKGMGLRPLPPTIMSILTVLPLPYWKPPQSSW